MICGGIQKSSLIDFPGKISCVLFLAGCNFDCPYCHNPGLAKDIKNCSSLLKEDEIFDFLEKRKGFLDGVVISGGEPTLQKDLPVLCKKIKEMGYQVKLDTNGSRPDRLKQLIHMGLVDYVAMDIKTDPLCYDPLIKKNSNPDDILSSILTIMEDADDYEFRTTCVKGLVDGQIIENIAKVIKNAKKYALQLFNMTEVLHPDYFKVNNVFYSKDELMGFKSVAEKWVMECVVR